MTVFSGLICLYNVTTVSDRVQMHRTILILSIIIGILLSVLPQTMAQPQPSNMGIFTATADWGLEPDFPPILYDIKIPGRVEISNTTGEPVYDIFGNGLDIGVQQTSDEAFYVYNQQNDSFQISGKFKMMDVDEDRRSAQTGFMLRQNATETSSSYFAVVLNYMPRSNDRSNLESKWRLPTDTEANYLHYGDSDGNPVGSAHEEVYLRLTYNKPRQTAFSEWSYDGAQWHWMHELQIDMGENPSIGIFAHNVNEVYELVHARVSEVQINKPIFVERQLSSNFYTNDDIVDVTLVINNHTTAAKNVSLTEVIPQNVIASDFTHSPEINGATAVWQLTLMPGEHYIRYQLQPSSTVNGILKFTGYSDGLPILGDRFLTVESSLFDQYADLGLPEFRSSDPKTQTGSTIIRTQNGETEYEITGYGLLDGSDHSGMYLYTEKDGSLRMTAHLKWLSEFNDSQSAKMGIAIREKGNQSRTKSFSSNLLLQDQELLRSRKNNDGLEINWQNGLNRNVQFWHTPFEKILDQQPPDLSDGIFVRLTRILPLNLFHAEWSQDGEHWNMARQEYIYMQDQVAYGLQVGSGGSPQQTRGLFSNVNIEPAPVTMTRSFSKDTYRDGDSIRVTLIAYTPPNDDSQYSIIENLPRRWKIITAGRNGRIKRNSIEWSFSSRFQLSYLTYTALAPVNARRDAEFSATINGQPVKSNDTLSFQRISSQQTRRYSVEQGIYVAVPLTLTLLHMLLYFFYPVKPENLYYAIFTASVAFVSFFTYQSYFFTFASDGNDDIILLVVLSLCFMLRFFYSLVQDKLPLRMWVWCFTPFFIVLLISIWYMAARRGWISVFPSDPWIYTIIAPGVFILMRESIIVLNILRCKKEEGYTILITGMAIMLVLIQYVLFWGLGSNSGFWTLPQPIFEFHQSPIFYAPLLITMSIFLAYRFARTNINLMTLNTQLEERVMERTKQFEEANTELTSANASLQEANVRLQELDKMKSSFVSQASHDLRTPLTAIKGSLDNLILGIAGELNEKQNRVLNRAITSVNRLTDLINDVLDLNRIESGRVVLEKSNFNVCDAVKMMINENKPAAAEKEIAMTADGTSQSISIHADRSKLERVFGECISNAVKYTPNGGSIHVAVSIEHANQKPEMVCVSVKDSGMGLSKEDCSKVFERFYRVDAAKNTAKGSGLGLSIAKELVEMHEGKIEVKSEIGQGTEFRLCLPIQLSNPK